jgi:23S rRNA (pseudouridine1915-N3)-methyltransferase
MQLSIANIAAKAGTKSARANPKSQYEVLTRLYIERIHPYIPCQSETFPSESAFLAWLANPKQSGKSARLPALPVLLDSRGRQFSSTEFAAWLGARRDQGIQHIVFAIGPADGWTPAANAAIQAQSGLALSFGPITMAHDLARLVLAEQLYRACTILAGHPYHTGH